MRDMILGTVAVVGAGLGVYFIPLDGLGGAGGEGYALTTAQAMSRLAQADLRHGKVPFSGLEVQVTKPAPNVLEYAATGTFATINCRVELTPSGDRNVTAATSCNRSAADGAAASATQDMTNLAFAEYIDSVLDGRPFDEGKVSAQSAGAVLKNLPKMQAEALKMSRDMAKMEREAAANGAALEGEPAAADWAGEAPGGEW